MCLGAYYNTEELDIWFGMTGLPVPVAPPPAPASESEYDSSEMDEDWLVQFPLLGPPPSWSGDSSGLYSDPEDEVLEAEADPVSEVGCAGICGQCHQAAHCTAGYCDDCWVAWWEAAF